jgi:hypothetical protein
MKPTLPLEIFEYKLNWRPGYTVRLHSDLRLQAKEWCKKNCDMHEWELNEYTNVYEHTFCFEKKQHADTFSKLWPKFTNQ